MIIIQFLFGASLASFFNLVAVRTLRGESIVSPRSHCDNCNAQLENFDLIPVFSYLMLKGKCRYCKQEIPGTFFVMELMVGIAAASLDIRQVRWSFILCLLILIALSSFDIIEQKIPSKGIIGLFFICTLSCVHPVRQILVALFMYIVMQLMNRKIQWMGSGDIDIYACLWLTAGMPSLLWQTFIACIAALIYLIVAPWPKDSRIPFVPFITIGYFLTYQFHDILLPLIL
ncbi:prepilin peptidase [Lentilactobacillus otakiensis]|uniref:Type 4 prepilin family protein specific leader peptidase n=1 Tax=Lentilactobacillus otakiensis DSM 19908 = JCM 15040 TaxID=1423780 RepID=S4PPU8_9LACO|nr:A24 family peptidase [Lentilactobacillus otakiensis]KRL09764.1 peptidase A24A domain-containing protein [Lentilactobacillus otakiensis DSM 19908 = JCM 15040]MBZ3776332.1 prepilin peptidase [Lentilactobacillus otakiensis]MDV3517115.1 prepilin peptidase [Lentilactobacillus otakiensis]GAD16650.1 type 4 prepilin family protein specific leader peptidase [Lentilactobacillus otakiensis DSM 19908 = JCM 15040]